MDLRITVDFRLVELPYIIHTLKLTIPERPTPSLLTAWKLARANEGSSRACDRTRGVPGQRAITDEDAQRTPPSTADSAPTNGVVVSVCANERGSIAHDGNCPAYTTGRCLQGDFRLLLLRAYYGRADAYIHEAPVGTGSTV